MFRLRLKEVREEKGLSQQALGETIGEAQSVRAYRQVSPTERNIICKPLEILPLQKKPHL